MRALEFVKEYKLFDMILLVFDELNFSDQEISTMLNVSTQTLHNAKKRNEKLLQALKMLDSPPTEYGNTDINKVVNTFAERFGTTKTTKYDRWAAKRLIDKYGVASIVTAISALAENSSDKYCPVVNSVSQFETKLPNVVGYFNKKSNNQVISL